MKITLEFCIVKRHMHMIIFSIEFYIEMMCVKILKYKSLKLSIVSGESTFFRTAQYIHMLQ